jgi:para-nitrobenzyl esterase
VVLKFLGVPYAAPPTGAERWRPPRPPHAWRGVRGATREPANCPQAATPNRGLLAVSLDERCLGLDIVTPATGKRLRPVFVFIHGGSFMHGHAGNEVMTQFVKDSGVIAVTINYRLGAFGFLDLPGMNKADAGNFALLDQLRALGWVKRNIRAFGGNADRVTVGGQSAGGGSVCALLASPLARGLFERAILESPWDCRVERTRAQARAQSISLAHRSGCRHALLSCLRAKPVATIVQAENTFPLNTVGPVLTWAPESGDRVLPRSPSRAFSLGTYNRVPVLLGSNRDDIPGLGCQTQQMAEALSRRGATYRYEFADQTAPPLPGRPLSVAGSGAQHAAELEYLYLFNGVPAPLDKAQRRLAETMIGYWSAFIWHGDPNGRGRPLWPRFTTTGRNLVVLTADGITTTRRFDQVTCT